MLSRSRLQLYCLDLLAAITGKKDVDIVVKWVDGNDPAWLKRFRKYNPENLDVHSNGRRRFKDWGQFRFCIRSIFQYAPWIRRIHIVTASQCPEWLDTNHPKINLLFHEDIFACKEHLPTFNFNAIDMNLTGIKGLSEYFIFFQDDMFINRKLHYSDVFTLDGLPRIKESFHEYADKYIWQKNVRNDQAIVSSFFGTDASWRLCHFPIPMRRSILVKVKELFPEPAKHTSQSKFRTSSNINFHIYQFFALASGNCSKNASYRTSFFTMSDYPTALRDFLNRTHENTLFVCVNDGIDTPTHDGEMQQILGAFFQERFPDRCAAEL